MSSDISPITRGDRGLSESDDVESVVEVFTLEGHAKAKRAYAWQLWEDENAQYTVVLEIPPVDSANTAVRASIAAEAKR